MTIESGEHVFPSEGGVCQRCGMEYEAHLKLVPSDVCSGPAPVVLPVPTPPIDDGAKAMAAKKQEEPPG